MQHKDQDRPVLTRIDIKRLTKLTGQSESTVRRSIKRLLELGVIRPFCDPLGKPIPGLYELPQKARQMEEWRREDAELLEEILLDTEVSEEEIQEFAESMVPLVTGGNSPDWLLWRVALLVDRWTIIRIVEGLVFALKEAKMDRLLTDQVRDTAQHLARHVIGEGYIPTPQIAKRWREELGLFERPHLKRAK